MWYIIISLDKAHKLHNNLYDIPAQCASIGVVYTQCVLDLQFCLHVEKLMKNKWTNIYDSLNMW